ncbi:MAG: papain-like cysteine protease family protein [Oscillatoria sp. PMC 1051.18]|nr:papain-like cysteine protease family protein [Oscillatoria sp. PMC 1050.18]MEC5033320.1 papain-like cysteine protease family protein [Oscillatoria sp. PMC 1051.18]
MQNYHFTKINTVPFIFVRLLSGYFSLAEISAARNIRNNLAGLQLSSYSYLISATTKYAQGGQYKINDFFLDLSLDAFFSLAPVLAPYLVSGVRGLLAQLKSVPTQDNFLAGAGVNWPTINEAFDSSIVRQATSTSCGPACAEIIFREMGIDVSQRQIISIMGQELSFDELLAMAMNQAGPPGSSWVGTGVSMESLDVLMNIGPWIAMINNPGNSINHWVVVEGWDAAGNILIKDPWDSTIYSVTVEVFEEF